MIVLRLVVEVSYYSKIDCHFECQLGVLLLLDHRSDRLPHHQDGKPQGLEEEYLDLDGIRCGVNGWREQTLGQFVTFLADGKEVLCFLGHKILPKSKETFQS